MDSFRKKLLRGFTLIEIIVVIAIIGILSSGLTLALSYFVTNSQEQTYDQMKKEACRYVQNWLIDLEVKDFDMDILTPNNTGTSDGPHYIWLASVKCRPGALTGPFDVGPEKKNYTDLKVALLSTTSGFNDEGGVTVTLGVPDNFSPVNASGLTSEQAKEKAYDALKALSETIAPSFDGQWVVLVNTTTYTVEFGKWYKPGELDKDTTGSGDSFSESFKESFE